MGKEITPRFSLNVFTCPHCHVAATQTWSQVYSSKKKIHLQSSPGLNCHEVIPIDTLFTCACTHCNSISIWFQATMLFPTSHTVPAPNDDMSPDVKSDYKEAALIVDLSPRASAALLRLALQKLMPHIGESGENINDDIASLVKKGVDEHIQQSFDIVRIIGNEAVHPGQIDLKDDKNTALFLFDLLNLIVENKISHPKRIKGVYQTLPMEKLSGIFNRDKK